MLKELYIAKNLTVCYNKNKLVVFFFVVILSINLRLFFFGFYQVIFFSFPKQISQLFFQSLTG